MVAHAPSVGHKIMAVFLSLCFCLLGLPRVSAAVDASRARREQAAQLPTIIAQTQGWKLTSESKKQGYILTISSAKGQGFAVCTIRSSKETERLQASAHVDCQGIVETEIDATPYRGKTLHIEVEPEATVTDTAKNQAWFSLLIDDKAIEWLHGAQYGPVVTRGAGTERDFVVPPGANKIKLVLRLQGLGTARLHLLQIIWHRESGSATQDQPAVYEKTPTNLDFSSGLNGWITMVLTPDYGSYKATVDTGHGSRFARLSFVSGYYQVATFSQTLDAQSWHGQTVALDADCRAGQKSKGKIFIMASVHAPADREGKDDAIQGSQRGYFAKSVEGDSWKHYRVITEVDNTARKLEFGLALAGKGSVDIRNVRLSPVNPAESGDEAAAPLSPEQSKNLLLFAKAYGCIRYFYPEADLSSDDWNSYLGWAVRTVLSSKNETGQEILRAVLSPIAPGLQLVPSNQGIAYCSPGQSPEHWKHTGYGADRAIFNLGCHSVIIHGNDSIAPSGASTTAQCGPFTIGDGLACLWTAKQNATAITALPPPIKQSQNDKPAGWSASGNDRVTRLAGVIALWNAARYFYPGDEELGPKWQQVLSAALVKAAVDPGQAAFAETLEQMTPPLRDDQCRIFNNRIEGLGLVSTKYSANLCWEFFKGKLITTGSANPLHPMRLVGESVTNINGSPLEQMLTVEKERVSAATPERMMHRIAQNFLLGPLRSSLVFRGENIGGEWKSRDIPIATIATSEGIISNEVTEQRPMVFTLLKPGTIYVDLTRISPADLKAHMKTICGAPRVVFDCRGTLCRGDEIIFQHLFSEPPALPTLMLPVIVGPETSDRKFVERQFSFSCLAPKLQGRSAFLIDSRTEGKMELYLMMIEAAKRGLLVGTRSAGTAGSVALARLPGDFLLSFTSTRTLKPDGSRFQGMGVLTTDEVVPSVDAIKALKDEVLDRAVLRLEQETR
jgi:hypothetical protein